MKTKRIIRLHFIRKKSLGELLHPSDSEYEEERANRLDSTYGEFKRDRFENESEQKRVVQEDDFTWY